MVEINETTCGYESLGPIHIMVVGKLVSKIVQSLPSWEVTKYYGRVCWFQLQCLKYRIQTSETWFNFQSKFMPDRLRNEAEHDDKESTKKEGSNKTTSLSAKSTLLMQKLDKLRKSKMKVKEQDSLKDNEEQQGVETCSKSNKGKKKKNSRLRSKK